MDLELLRTFLELERVRHFGRTAEAMHVTQAAVSARIKSLEGQLGVALFDRSGREIRVTPEGARLVRHAQRMIAAWRAARQDVSLPGSTQIVIGGSPRLWDVLLQRWMHDIRRNWPDMAIIATSQTPDLLTRRLIDGSLDVAIVLEPAQLDILQIEELAAVRLECVSTHRGQTIDTVFDNTYVYVDWGLSFALDHRRAFPDAPEAMTRVSYAKMALEFLTSVGGSAYLPTTMVARDLEFGLLHRVEGAPVFERQAYATYPVRSERIDLIERCLSMVKS